MALTDKLTAIADAIRGKTGKSDGLTLDQMATEIAGIEAGGGGGDIGAVKFIDVDITVDASTTTRKQYIVDGLGFISASKNPTMMSPFAGTEQYIARVTPKAYSGEATGSPENVFEDSSVTLYSINTNYIQGNTFVRIGSGKVSANNYGIYNVVLASKSVVDGKITSRLTVDVRHNSSNQYEVIPGTYNIQIWYMAGFEWEAGA